MADFSVNSLSQDSVVQFITILLPERHQRRAVSDAGTEHDRDHGDDDGFE